jgi:uncharacterized membrane protein
VKDLFSYRSFFWRYLGGTLLYSLFVLGGLLLLIIPGIIWGIRYQFIPYLIVDKNMSVGEAVRRSNDLTRGSTWELLGFSVVLLVINLLGVLAFIVGQLVTIPITMLAQAYVYRRLLSGMSLVEVKAPTPTI